jgi:hypothetical protein
LRQLVTSPGALTLEYLAGRRVRFISPLRLYLTCSFLFFLVKAVLPAVALQISTTTTQSGTGRPAGSSVQVGVVTAPQGDETESLKKLDELANSGRGLTRVWWSHFAAALRNKGALSAAVSANVPRMMFVLVPMFAGLVALVFRRRRMRYPQHLAFALHVHAFLFLALILTLAPRILKNHGRMNAVLVATSFALIGAHLVVAVRRVYGVGLGGAIVRSALISATYFVLYALAFAVVLVAAVMMF